MISGDEIMEKKVRQRLGVQHKDEYNSIKEEGAEQEQQTELR